jgi:hypothetical protein
MSLKRLRPERQGRRNRLHRLRVLHAYFGDKDLTDQLGRLRTAKHVIRI